MKKNIIFVLGFIFIFFIYQLVVNHPKDYGLIYNINSYNIKESYSKKDKAYYLNIYDDSTNYSFFLKRKYSKKRKLLENIDIYTDDEKTCVKPIVKNETFQYVCNKDNDYFMYLSNSLIESDKEKIDSIEVYNKDFTYYIFDGYGVKNVVTKKKIHFFNNEHYENALSYKGDNFILFANYDDERVFNKFYLIDKESEDYFEIVNENYEISYDSYFLGMVKNKVYLFDKKNMKEYSIDIKKRVIKLISKGDKGLFYDLGFDEILLSKLKYETNLFNTGSLVDYVINNSTLYKKYNNSVNRIKITDYSVKTIVSASDEEIFYISDDSLYSYNDTSGNTLLLTNFDWKFNYKNNIYVF